MVAMMGLGPADFTDQSTLHAHTPYGHDIWSSAITGMFGWHDIDKLHDSFTAPGILSVTQL